MHAYTVHAYMVYAYTVHAYASNSSLPRAYPPWMSPHFLPLAHWLEEEAGLSASSLTTCQWTVDPSNYAIVGAGAFLAGTVTRL